MLQTQQAYSTTVGLSLDDVIIQAKESSKLLGIQKIEAGASQMDLRDARIGALPRLHAAASYERFSKITVTAYQVTHD